MAEESVRGDVLSTLLPCSYGGVPLFFDSGSTIGGQRANARPILHSSEQIVSNVGTKQRTRNFRLFLAQREAIDARTGDLVVDLTYAEMRRALLAVFEDPTPKTFVHPLEGAITGLVAVNFAVDEGQNEWGLGRVTVEFIRDTRKPTPVPDLGVASAVVAASEQTRASFFESLAERWGIDTSVVGVFEDGLTKARAAFDSMQQIANEAETLTDGLEAFTAAMSEGLAAVAATIALPQKLANDLANSLDVLTSIFPTAVTAFEGMVRGFGFGELDLSIDLSVPSARIRKANKDAMDATINGAYLAEAYRFATGIEFVTLDEIESVESRLDAQWEAILDAGTATPESLDSLENLRTAFASYLDRARLSARKVVPDDTAPTTPRTLCFALYGDDALTRTIAGLNGVLPYQTLAGRVSVLSS